MHVYTANAHVVCIWEVHVFEGWCRFCFIFLHFNYNKQRECNKLVLKNMAVGAGTAGTAMAIPLFAPPPPETFFVSANLTEQYCKLQLKQIPYLVILTNTHWLHPSLIINIFFLI